MFSTELKNKARFPGKNLEEAAKIFNIRNYGRRYAEASLSKMTGNDEHEIKVLPFCLQPRNLLLISGPAGCGKTYLCASMTEWMLGKFMHYRFYKEEDLLRRLRQAIASGSNDYAAELKYAIDDEVIIIDDVGSGIDPTRDVQKSVEWRAEVLYSLLDYRLGLRGGITIMTTNFSHADFKKIYHDRITSRLFAGYNTIVDMSGMDDRRKAEI
jgi:DNA replication protein DnaC